MDSILNFFFNDIIGNLVWASTYACNFVISCLSTIRNYFSDSKDFIGKVGSIPILGLIFGPIFIPATIICAVVIAFIDAINALLYFLIFLINTLNQNVVLSIITLLSLIILPIILFPYLSRIARDPAVGHFAKEVSYPVRAAIGAITASINAIMQAK